jgi:hypothetical protein
MSVGNSAFVFVSPHGVEFKPVIIRRSNAARDRYAREAALGND